MTAAPLFAQTQAPRSGTEAPASDKPAVARRSSTNEDIVREFYAVAEAKNQNIDRFVSLFADDGYFLDVPSGMRWYGPEVRKAVEALNTAFPDMHRELLQLYPMGDTVVVELKLQATHLGDWQVAGGVLPATGKRFDGPCCDVFQLRGGKVVSFHCYSELSNRLEQIGVLRNLAANFRR